VFRMRTSKILAALAALLLVTSVPGPAALAADTDAPAGRLVSEVAAPNTPHVLDGRVYSVVQVGGTIVLGGTFTRVRNEGETTELVRNGLVAFDATTGRISTTFAPNPNGGVRVVLPSGDGTSVYVGGSFTSIAGAARQRVARVRVSDGALVTTFNAGGVTGEVRDLSLTSGRLWLGGAFTHVGGVAHPALATVNPTTGAVSPYMSLPIAGYHHEGATQVLKMDVAPDGSRLVAIGNFDTLAGATNHQLLVLDLTGASAAPSTFRTSFYTSGCSGAFDTYMRDVDISPDGSYFVVGTTGAYGGSEGACDTVARFELGASGSDVPPSWVDYTGGDTTYSVEATPGVVYVGGHQRWWNNPFAGDSAGQGAVSREGIAALDPVNGLPLTWNPGRAKGVGVFDFLSTTQGLWVASDTDRIGNYQLKSRIARFNPQGVTFPAVRTPTLPSDVYVGGPVGAATAPGVLYRVNAGGPALAAGSGPDWAADTDAQPSALHGDGSNRAGYAPVGAVDATVPAGTPPAVFDDELWDPSGGPDQTWAFPVPAGTPVEVRLYFADRCACTAGVGQRTFDVDIDAARVLSQLDLVQSVGHDVGTMRSFPVTSDGTVDVVLGHEVENPLLDGIEIVRTDVAPPASPSGLRRRGYDGTSAGPTVAAPTGGLDWAATRGAFMVNGSLYVAHADGTFTRRTFDGNTYGAPSAVATSDAIVPLTSWRDDIRNATGMFFDRGRIYYTLSGSAQLFYRYFSPQSGVVGAKRLVATGPVAGTRFAEVRGMFVTPTHLYWGENDGSLHRIGWAQAGPAGYPVSGTSASVAGPALDGTDWAAHSLFVYQGPDGQGTGEPPAGTVAHVASESATANGTTHRVVVPPGVQTGDRLLLHLTVNDSTVVPSGPPGWAAVDSADGTGVLGRSWTRTATATDPGSTVTVTTSATAKSALSVSAYRSSTGTSTVVAHAAAVDAVSGTAHTAPSVVVPVSGAWVVTSWVAKSSVDTQLVASAPAVPRSTVTGTGGGRLTALVADSGGPRPAGPSGGATATSTPAVTRTVMFTTAISPG
jgi:hypothetical protein